MYVRLYIYDVSLSFLPKCHPQFNYNGFKKEKLLLGECNLF